MKKSIKVKICKLANDEHRKRKRQYAHTFHNPKTICLSDAAVNLSPNQFWAIMAHEVGHLIAEPELRRRGIREHQISEDAANMAANDFFGIKIRYRDSKAGNNLQTITTKEVARVKRKISAYLK